MLGIETMPTEVCNEQFANDFQGEDGDVIFTLYPTCLREVGHDGRHISIGSHAGKVHLIGWDSDVASRAH